MNPLVSIIVPVYNAKAYIARCIDSILAQKYENMEILLVDDGCTDGSGRILDEYAAKDGRITVIHQANAGVSASRNLGLDRARGKYIQFADSDDWLAPEATKLMVEAAERTGCDLVIADFYRVVGERKAQKGDIDAEDVIDRMEFASYMIENPADFYYGVLWNKLFRRSLIEEHHLRMDREISWCEDFLFNLEYIRFAEKFYAVRTPVYYYVYRRGSLVSQSASITKTIQTKIHVFEYYSAFYKGVYGEDYDEVKVKVRKFLIDAAGDGGVRPEFPGSGYGFVKRLTGEAHSATASEPAELGEKTEAETGMRLTGNVFRSREEAIQRRKNRGKKGRESTRNSRIERSERGRKAGRSKNRTGQQSREEVNERKKTREAGRWKEMMDRGLKSKETKRRDSKEKELKGKESRIKELKERDSKESRVKGKGSKIKELKEPGVKGKEPKIKEPKEKDSKEKEQKSKDTEERKSPKVKITEEEKSV